MARFLRRAVYAAVFCYVLATLLLYLMQRRLQYFPNGDVISPAQAGVPEASALTLETRDGEKLQAWSIEAKPGRPTILYFFGNGGRLHFYARRFARMAAEGDGVLAISYRGYGASTGSATEEGLIEDGETAYRHLRSRSIADKSIAIMADSLGSGIAVQLAARHGIAALVLDSPFSSAVDVAGGRYPIFPVFWLMKDQFRSADFIRMVHAPLMVLHGTADQIVPIQFGRKLFSQANQPKRFIEVPDGGHVVTRDMLLFEQALAFINDPKAASEQGH